MGYQLTDRYNDIVDRLLKEEKSLSHINDLGVTIGIMESEKEKKTGGRIVYGDCMKVPERMKELVPYDFLITIYETNCMMLNPDQMKILLFHELLHVGAEADKNGNIKMYTIPHCIQEFSEIKERFGLDWSKPETLMNYMEEENNG